MPILPSHRKQLLTYIENMDTKEKLLRALPKVDECIALVTDNAHEDIPTSIIKDVIQKTISNQRDEILSGRYIGDPLTDDQWLDLFQETIRQKVSANFRRVINGTGVVIHTNLGRSILSEKTTDCLVNGGGYYSNLEFDLDTGQRGSRYSLVEEIICDLTGAEAALVVNNNAAAVLIALDTLAKGKEVIVSRGQLVEIGGSFRIPDIMSKSGACLKEVGATNRTHLFDYENAITDETAMLLRVHTSNFKIIGFTSDISPKEMVELAQKNDLVTMEDLGSGSLIDLSQYGFPKEPTVQEIVSSGIDVVTFSGDKLLGGPQAGIIVGNRDVVARIKKNPLNRALRIDKFTLSALESVLREYYDSRRALENVPTLAMLTASKELLKKRAQKILRRLRKKIESRCTIKTTETISKVGGGALPEFTLPSWAIELRPKAMNVSALEVKLRRLDIPIIGRIENDRFLLDVRTIQDREIVELVGSISELFNEV